MRTRKLVSVTIKILIAALAITLQLSAQDTPRHKFKVTTLAGRDDRSQVIVYSDSLADNGNIYKLFVFLVRRTGREGPRTVQWPSRTWQRS